MSTFAYSSLYKLRQHIHVDTRASFDYGEPAARKFRTSSRLIAAKHFSPFAFSQHRCDQATQSAQRLISLCLASFRARIAKVRGRCARYRAIRGVLRNCGDPSQIQFSKHPALRRVEVHVRSNRAGLLPVCVSRQRDCAGCSHEIEREKERECAVVAKCQHNWIRATRGKR